MIDVVSMTSDADEPAFEELSAEAAFSSAQPELFDGDAGSLGVDQRLCLIAILKNTFISSVEHGTHWETLIADDLLIKGRLNDMLMDLEIDREREVAYKVQVREADGMSNVPPLLRASTYTREETALLIFLRSRYTSERADGQEQVWVERDEMHSHVENLRPEHATDVAGDQRRTTNAIASLAGARILQGKQDGNSFRIAPVIETLLPVGALRDLAQWFAAQRQTGADTDTDTPDPTAKTSDE